jgi:hypothetical protein
MAEVRIIKKYVTSDVLNELNSWTLNNYKHHFFSETINMNSGGTRYTTRQCVNRNRDWLFDYPNVVYDLQKRICNDFCIENELVAPIGKNGIVTGIGFENDYIKEHIDPIWVENTETVHFNIISQKSNVGGVTIIENEPYDIDEGDLLVINVSKHKHKVTKTFGNIPRILYVFGFSLNNNKIKNIFI